MLELLIDAELLGAGITIGDALMFAASGERDAQRLLRENGLDYVDGALLISLRSPWLGALAIETILSSEPGATYEREARRIRVKLGIEG